MLTASAESPPERVAHESERPAIRSKAVEEWPRQDSDVGRWLLGFRQRVVSARDGMDAAVEQFQRELDRLPPMDEILAGFQRAVGSVVQAVQRLFPSNWSELEAKEMEVALALGVDEGISLIWVPRV